VINRSAFFDGDDYIELADELAILRGTGSLSVWIKTTQVGNDTMWRAPGLAGIEEEGGGDDVFWGWIDVAGHIGLTYANEVPTKSTTVINDDTWHHIVLTRDSSTGEVVVYVDGIEEERNTLAAGTVSSSRTFTSLGRIEDTGGTPEYFEGYLDEVEIYNTVLTPAEVTDIYDNESSGNNWDGSPRQAADCSAQANNSYFQTAANDPVSGNVLDDDIGAGLQVTSNTSPAEGSLSGSGVNADGTFTYTPNSDYTGSDSFDYTIEAEDGSTSGATVYISVEEPIILDDTLVAEYRLDECGFDGTDGDVIDNTINRLNGITVDGVTKTTADNKLCTGASFDGVDDYIEVAHDDKLNFDNGFTVALWVYMTDDRGTLISKMDGTGTGDDGWDLEIYNSGYIDFDHNGWSRFIRSSSLSTDTWHHVVAVYDPSASNELILYINGIKDSEGNQDTSLRNATTTPLTLGWGAWDNHYQGELDEAKVWNRALSATEITTMYSNESAGRNWNNDTDTRICNTCSCTAFANSSTFVSIPADFRNMTSGKDVETMLGSYFPGSYGTEWIVAGYTYEIGAAPDGDNDGSYHIMGSSEDLEYGMAYWIKNSTSNDVDYNATLKTMDFDATIEDYPDCRSANGKCILVDLVSPNGTDNNGPYIYTMTSFPISKSIDWKEVRIPYMDQ